MTPKPTTVGVGEFALCLIVGLGLSARCAVSPILADVAPHRSNTDSEFYRRWSPRVGDAAIDAYVHSSRYLLIAWCWWFLGALPLYYVHLQNPAERLLWVPTLAAVFSGAVSWMLALRYSTNYRKLVGEHFGIQLPFGEAPSLRYEEHFDYWCHTHGIGSGSIVALRFRGPSAAFLRALGVICSSLAVFCFVGLVMPGVPGSQRPGWAVAVFVFASSAVALVHLARNRPTGVSRGDVRRAFGRRPVE